MEQARPLNLPRVWRAQRWPGVVTLDGCARICDIWRRYLVGSTRDMDFRNLDPRFITLHESASFREYIARVEDAVRQDEREKWQPVIAAITQVMGAIPSAALPLTQAHKDQGEATTTEAVASKRAPHGFVLGEVRRVYQDSSIPLAPAEVVYISRKQGKDLNPSSVRMAAQTLQKQGVVESVGHGKYLFKVHGAVEATASGDASPSVTGMEAPSQAA